MAKSTYRLFHNSLGQTQVGNALFALTNSVGSGKKISITQMEIYNQTVVKNTLTANSTNFYPNLYRFGLLNGADTSLANSLPLVKMDSTASTLTTVRVMDGGTYTSTGAVYRISSANKGFPGTGVAPTGSTTTMNYGNRDHVPCPHHGVMFNASTNTSVMTMPTIKAGETAGLYVYNDGTIFYNYQSLPLFIEGTIIVSGKSYSFSMFDPGNSDTECILTIQNDAGSGLTVQVADIRITEVGSADTPYLQIIPISSVLPESYADTMKQLTPFRFDSTSPAWSTSVGYVFTDVAVLPYGVPVSYIADASSAGVPKGFNYMQTKDFIGPVYQSLLPEGCGCKNASATNDVIPTTFGTNLSQTLSDVINLKDPIVIREGEGVAMVSAAELATGSNPVATSGWLDLRYGITIVVENATTPSITLTGVQDGSEVRAYVGTNPTTNVELYGIESTSGGTVNFTHDVAGQNGYIMIFHMNWLPIKLDFSPYTAEVVSIPIQQTTERNYSNP